MTIDETSLVAQSYIPICLRNINVACSNYKINIGESYDLKNQISKLRRQISITSLHLCQCQGGIHNLKAPSVKLKTEVGFALRSRRTYEEKKDVATIDECTQTLDYIRTSKELLEAEREEILHLYERYSQYAVPVKVMKGGTNTRHATITAPGIADAKPSILSGDTVIVRPLRNISIKDKIHSCWTMPVFALEITSKVVNVSRGKDGMDKVEFVWTAKSKELNKSYPENQYNVRILPSTTKQERCLTALAWVASLPNSVSKRLLFPDESPKMPESNESATLNDDWNLNEKQKSYVKMVCARTVEPSRDIVRSPMILSGPAGTGKTRTLLACIFEVLSRCCNSHILVCTPSHTAADVITDRLGSKLDKAKLWRLVDPSRPSSTLPAKLLPFCQQDNKTGIFRLPEKVEDLFKYRVIVCTCSDAHILYDLGLTNHQLQSTYDCLQNLKRIRKQGSLFKNDVFEKITLPHFTHLFIDEAAQATEAEVMIPFSVVVDPAKNTKKTEIGLVGDPRQLSPNIYSETGKRKGLGSSYMERLLQRPMNYLTGGWPNMLGNPEDHFQSSNQFLRSSVFLTAIYRGKAPLLMMPSSLFYFDKLGVIDDHDDMEWNTKMQSIEKLSKPATELAIQWNKLPSCQVRSSSWDNPNMGVLEVRRQGWPVHFRGVVGQDASCSIESFAGSSSWCNREEAAAVVEIISCLVRNGVSTSSIGVMSPFRGQVVLVRKQLRRIHLNSVDVGTVEDYQAVERDVIILSLTRSNPKLVPYDIQSGVGLFKQVKRTNVALTRSKQLLIVVGNPVVMVKDAIWKQMLWFFLRNGLWYGEKLVNEDIEELQKKPVKILEHRSIQESNSLLSPRNETEENVVYVSSMERVNRKQ